MSKTLNKCRVRMGGKKDKMETGTRCRRGLWEPRGHVLYEHAAPAGQETYLWTSAGMATLCVGSQQLHGCGGRGAQIRLCVSPHHQSSSYQESGGATAAPLGLITENNTELSTWHCFLERDQDGCEDINCTRQTAGRGHQCF
jgi:hypothetical protein